MQSTDSNKNSTKTFVKSVNSNNTANATEEFQERHPKVLPALINITNNEIFVNPVENKSTIPETFTTLNPEELDNLNTKMIDPITMEPEPSTSVLVDSPTTQPTIIESAEKNDPEPAAKNLDIEIPTEEKAEISTIQTTLSSHIEEHEPTESPAKELEIDDRFPEISTKIEPTQKSVTTLSPTTVLVTKEDPDNSMAIEEKTIHFPSNNKKPSNNLDVFTCKR